MRLLRATVTLIVTTAILLTAFSLRAQQAGGDTEGTGGFYYQVWGPSTNDPNRDHVWSQPFNTEAAAQEELNSIERSYAKGGILEYSKERPIRLYIKTLPRSDQSKSPSERVNEATDVVGKVKSALNAEERKVGDTLRGYATRVTIAYQQVVYAKKKLTETTGNITKKQFDDVNKAIDRFNKTRTEFAEKIPSSGPLQSRYAPMLDKRPTVTTVMPQELKGTLVGGQGKLPSWYVEPPKMVDVKPLRVEAQPKPQRRTEAPPVEKPSAPSERTWTAADIVGTWYYEGKVLYQFDAGGTGTTYQWAPALEPIRWRVENNTLYINHPKSDNSFWEETPVSVWANVYNKR